jgi:hypothetical protein
MLRGTKEELEYHEARAADELAISNSCDDVSISNAHLELANLHRTRSELVTALLNSGSKRRNNHIHSADKEC